MSGQEENTLERPLRKQRNVASKNLAGVLGEAAASDVRDRTFRKVPQPGCRLPHNLREPASCLERLRKLLLQKHLATHATLWEPQTPWL